MLKIAKRLNRAGGFFLLFLMIPVVVYGQDIEAACRAFVEEALIAVSENCVQSDNNSACYGTGVVGGTFLLNDDTLQQFTFDENSIVAGTSIVPLVNEGSALASMQTYAFPEDNDTGAAIDLVAPDANTGETFLEGAAIIKSSAGLPPQVTDAGLTMIVLGNTRVENAVTAEQSFIADTIMPITVTDAALYADYDDIMTMDNAVDIVTDDMVMVIDTVSGDFEAFAVSEDGLWLRVFYVSEGTYGLRTDAWLSVDALAAPVDVSILPVFDADSYAPMQRIYVTLDNESTAPDCGETVTNGILIQSQSGIETEVWINDLPIRLSSTVYISLLNEQTMQVVTLEGFVTVFPGTSQERVMIAGYGIETGNYCLGDEANQGLDGAANDRSVDGCSSETLLATIENAIANPDENSNITPLPEPVPLSNEFLAQFTVINVMDDALVTSLPVLVVVQASGAGDASVSVINSDADNTQQVTDLCSSGALPAYLCTGS